jgi:hypothetical protein
MGQKAQVEEMKEAKSLAKEPYQSDTGASEIETMMGVLYIHQPGETIAVKYSSP